MRNLIAAAAFALALAGTAVQAQIATPAPTQATPAPAVQPQHKQPNPAHEAKHLSKQLGLTPDQTAKIEPILAERQQKISDLMATNPDKKTMHQQRTAIMDDSDAKLGAVLTSDQQTQYAAIKAAHRHHGEQPAAPPAAV